MAGLYHGKCLFAGMGYGSFIHNANWDLKGLNGKKFRDKDQRECSFTKWVRNFSADAYIFGVNAQF